MEFPGTGCDENQECAWIQTKDGVFAVPELETVTGLTLGRRGWAKLATVTFEDLCFGPF